MTSPVEALREALTAQFASDPVVMILLGDPIRLYDERSTRAAFPHASWGRIETHESGADGVRLLEVRLGLDVWYRDGEPGPVLDALADSVTAAALPDLPEPWRLITLTPAYRDVFATRERRLKRGLLRLRAVVGGGLA
ncbi:DUF3168 domain-containing protein [Maricaulis sp.]|uniref:DUF3168 domain-containing protein n=1 Tax=Maricaulis sp. TaxID=1486257 RepID=UPI003A8E17DB